MDAEIVSEYMTTKTCSKCKKKNEVIINKIYERKKCGLKADRDINAAKYIRYI